ncbi:MAG TPA: CDP-alcohol phosphatidyltransferase family protein [Streptosporangiaceae bacterium]
MTETAVKDRPTVAEVKAGGQPPGVLDRTNEEHWAGRAYGRHISPYFTWLFVRLGVTPNTVTVIMVVCGVLAGVALGFGSGVWSALAAAVLIQIYLILDCSDGEVARFTGKTSIAGVYLDRIGHYLSELGLLIGLGFRASGYDHTVASGYVTAGLAAAVGAALIKAETDNVFVSRYKAGLGEKLSDEALAPRGSGMSMARRAAALLRFHRIILAVELSVLALVAALVDLVRGDLLATRVLVIVCFAVAALQAVLHLVSILASRRLS